MVIRFSDKLSDDVLAAFYRETAVYIGRYPVRTAFIDFSDVTGVDVSTAIVQRLAKTPPLLSDPMPRVIIAPSDLLFGLSRMMKSLSGEQREAVHIVRTEQAALAHLGIYSPLHCEAVPPVEPKP